MSAFEIAGCRGSGNQETVPGIILVLKRMAGLLMSFKLMACSLWPFVCLKVTVASRFGFWLVSIPHFKVVFLKTRFFPLGKQLLQEMCVFKSFVFRGGRVSGIETRFFPTLGVRLSDGKVSHSSRPLLVC